MEKREKNQILNDYQIALDNLDEIRSGKRPNFFVRSEHYLSPTILTKSLPLEDPHGELIYFSKICHCLNSILIDNKTSLYLNHAPTYIKTFFE